MGIHLRPPDARWTGRYGGGMSASRTPRLSCAARGDGGARTCWTAWPPVARARLSRRRCSPLWTGCARGRQAGDVEVSGFRDDGFLSIRRAWGGWLGSFEERDQAAKEDDARRRIVTFKDVLTAMGKEGLFFRWIELLQYESSPAWGLHACEEGEDHGEGKGAAAGSGGDFEESCRGSVVPSSFLVLRAEAALRCGRC
ncbi:hypothetical protein MRB53_040118 [Persea americana]|nr:hypothetical protein MRB53_040118 [Persea americana]